MLLALGQSTRGNGEQLGVRHFSDGDFTAIEHLDGFSVQLVGNFADSCQIAILGPFRSTWLQSGAGQEASSGAP